MLEFLSLSSSANTTTESSEWNTSLVIDYILKVGGSFTDVKTLQMDNEEIRPQLPSRPTKTFMVEHAYNRYLASSMN